MKFTLRDLIWATLAVGLLLVIGANWFNLRKQTAALHSHSKRMKAAEREAAYLRAMVDDITTQMAISGNDHVIKVAPKFGKSIKSVVVAQCVRIIDGDTIECLSEENNKFNVRLESIDCPERGEPFSKKAKQFTGDLCHENTVTIRVTGKDRFGRTLAVVEVNSKDVSTELLKAGLAKHYKQYSDDETLAGFEKNAREEKLGIWGGD